MPACFGRQHFHPLTFSCNPSNTPCLPRLKMPLQQPLATPVGFKSHPNHRIWVTFPKEVNLMGDADFIHHHKGWAQLQVWPALVCQWGFDHLCVAGTLNDAPSDPKLIRHFFISRDESFNDSCALPEIQVVAVLVQTQVNCFRALA